MIILPLFLLTVSPWFVQLFISPLELNWLTQPISSLSAFWRNLAFYSSPELIFFSGDPRLTYSTQEFGLIYLTFFPFFLIGLIKSLSQTPQKFITWWLGAGLLIASAFKPLAPFSATLVYLPAIQILITLGARHLIANFRQFRFAIQIGIILLVLLNLYEILNFFHVLATHYPQHIHQAVTNQL